MSPVPSRNGYRYYVHFTDAFSCFSWIYFLNVKSSVYNTFLKLKAMSELQLNAKLKFFRSNWEGKFQKLTPFFAKFGIVHQTSCPTIHEQNGLAKRKHRQIFDQGLSILALSYLPLTCWDDALYFTVFVINRLPLLLGIFLL